MRETLLQVVHRICKVRDRNRGVYESVVGVLLMLESKGGYEWKDWRREDREEQRTED